MNPVSRQRAAMSLADATDAATSSATSGHLMRGCLPGRRSNVDYFRRTHGQRAAPFRVLGCSSCFQGLFLQEMLNDVRSAFRRKNIRVSTLTHCVTKPDHLAFAELKASLARD